MLSVSIADLPVPPPVADIPEARRLLLILLGNIAKDADDPSLARGRWRDLGRLAHGLLVVACEGTARTPEWWLSEAVRLERTSLGRGPGCALPVVTHRVADILAIERARADLLAEIAYWAYTQTGDLK